MKNDGDNQGNPHYIIKGNLIPEFNEETKRVVYSEKYEARKLKELMEKLLNNLKEVIKEFFNYTYPNGYEKIRYETVDETKCDSNLRKLHALADLIVLFFRLPLIGEVDPKGEIRQTYYVIPIIEYLANYVQNNKSSYVKNYLYSEIKDEEEVKEINDKNPAIEALLVELPHMKSKLKLLVEKIKKSFDIVRKALFEIPSDTRPLANTSSLIVHTIVTSALAWGELKYIYSGGMKETRIPCEKRYLLEIIRLAALLHDIGKPIKWKNHVSASKEEAKKLLSEFLDEKLLDLILEYIGKHHIRTIDKADDALVSLIKADRYSSGQDRLLKGVTDWLAKKEFDIKKFARALDITEDDAEKFRELVLEWINGKDGWSASEELYNKFSIDKIVEFNDLLIKELKGKSEEEVGFSLKEKILNAFKDVKSISSPSGLVVYKIDLRGIQNFIYSGSKLAEIVFGSRLVEYLQVVEFPLKLIQEGIPLETILYAAGGNIYMIIPETLVSEIEDIVNKTLNRGAYSGLGGISIIHPIEGDFMSTLEKVEKLTGLRKLVPIKVGGTERPFGSGVFPPIFKLCDSCRIRPAIIADKGEYLCLTCYAKRHIGKYVHFFYKWEHVRFTDPLKDIVGNRTWEDMGVCVLEFIAGHPLEELCIKSRGGEDERCCINCKLGKKREYMSYAIIKMDANAVGKYLAETYTLTHLVYKSFRIDLATKQAISKFVKELYKLANSQSDNVLKRIILEDVIRVYLGLMYVGGDDVLGILPSYLALPFTQFVALEFTKRMGFDLTVSIGIIAGKPKMNIWEMFEAAELLLDDIAKKEGRKSKPKIVNGLVDDIGSLTYVFWKTPTVTKHHVEALIEYDKSLGLRYKAIKISEVDGQANLYDLLKIILIGQSRKQNISYSNYFNKLMSAVYEIIKELHMDPTQSKNLMRIKNLKALRKEVIDVIGYIRKTIEMGIKKDFAVSAGLVRLERNHNRLSVSKTPDKVNRLNAIDLLREIYHMSVNPYNEVPLIETLQAIDFILGGVTS